MPKRHRPRGARRGNNTTPASRCPITTTLARALVQSPLPSSRAITPQRGLTDAQGRALRFTTSPRHLTPGVTLRDAPQGASRAPVRQAHVNPRAVLPSARGLPQSNRPPPSQRRRSRLSPSRFAPLLNRGCKRGRRRRVVCRRGVGRTESPYSLAGSACSSSSGVITVRHFSSAQFPKHIEGQPPRGDAASDGARRAFPCQDKRLSQAKKERTFKWTQKFFSFSRTGSCGYLRY